MRKAPFETGTYVKYIGKRTLIGFDLDGKDVYLEPNVTLSITDDRYGVSAYRFGSYRFETQERAIRPSDASNWIVVPIRGSMP